MWTAYICPESRRQLYKYGRWVPAFYTLSLEWWIDQSVNFIINNCLILIFATFMQYHSSLSRILVVLSADSFVPWKLFHCVCIAYDQWTNNYVPDIKLNLIPLFVSVLFPPTAYCGHCKRVLALLSITSQESEISRNDKTITSNGQRKNR